MENQLSWKERVLGKSNRTMDIRKDVGAQYGWSVEAGNRLQERIESLRELNLLVHGELDATDAKQRLLQLLIKIQEVDKRVREVSMIWIAAGSDKRAQRAVRGYEGLLSKIIRDTNLCMDGLKDSTTSEQINQVRHMERFVNIIYFQCAMFLVDVSFNKEETQPTLDKTWVFPPTIQNQRPFRSIEPAENLVKKEEQPSRSPYPERLEEDI